MGGKNSTGTIAGIWRTVTDGMGIIGADRFRAQFLDKEILTDLLTEAGIEIDSDWTDLMCVQIGNPLFWIAYCVLRKGRRDGHDSVALLSGKVPVSNGIHIGSIFAAVEGVDGQERCNESSTGDYERLCEIWARNFGRNTADAAAGKGGAWWRHTGRAGGLFAVVAGVAQAGAHV